MTLEEAFAAATSAETKLIPLFVKNPQSQAIAGVAFLGEQALFALISSLHQTHAAKAAGPTPAYPGATIPAGAAK